ncbi:GIY-YIG nuclease family protein [Halpernia sp.]|uniref:GIY-YIG nuclease family protein n=1 Tax=Halpernia sp. TaxID=2782209 RepID=UPI003A94A666
MKTFATHNYYVYILTNKIKTVLYTGVTNDLKNRLYWHKNPEAISRHFTTKYKCYFLIFFEHYQDIDIAINREKQIKGWTRKKKDELISNFNSSWRFLNDEV